MEDVIKPVLDYLVQLNPRTAVLQILTVLSMATIYRFTIGDFDNIYPVLVRNPFETEINLRNKFEPIFKKYEVDELILLSQTGGSRVSLVVYHEEFDFADNYFKSLKKSVVGTTVLSRTDSDEDIVYELLSDLPVAYNQGLDDLLGAKCAVNNPMSSNYYLEPTFSTIGVKGFISCPLTNGNGLLKGFLTLFFYDEDERYDNDYCATLLQELATKIENDYMFKRAIGIAQ